MAEPADLGTTYSRAYNAAERTGPSCCAHVAGLEAVADAAKRRVLDRIEEWADDEANLFYRYPLDALVKKLNGMREELDRGDAN